VEFDIDEIERLRSYAEIRAALPRKKIALGLPHMLNKRNLFKALCN
jgi:hypothetical protein